MSDQQSGEADRSGAVVAVSVVAVALLGGAILYQQAAGAPPSEIEATSELATTVGKAGFGVYGIIAVGKLVFNR
ncbi:MAG: hypothetical protein HQRvContig02_31 [Haloquadratum phage sp.]|nr:MAG: hypothetical protein HQRvContig02_31 [Haloquadratum phage sp.]